MSHVWESQGITLEHFSPLEFDHPEEMDASFLRDLDQLRMRCAFPLTITDDARTEEELRTLYAREIAKGRPYPTDSAHLVVEGAKVRCVDLKPTPPTPDDSPLSLEERELKLTYEILRMWREGRWRALGLGLESAHWHVDDTPRLGAKRPAFWVAVSR